MRGLKDKVAIVTGAAGRIGKSVVRRLVEEEARVVAADINVDAAQALVAEFGSQAIAIGFDSADEASIKALMDQTMAHFGSIDILHNNAAYVALGELGEDEIGSASCRERVCEYVWVPVVAGSLKK